MALSKSRKSIDGNGMACAKAQAILIFDWLYNTKRPTLVSILPGGVIAALGDDLDTGPVYAHINRAKLAVDDRLVAQVTEGVLGSRLLGDLGVALLNAIQVKGRWMRLK
jgi:hypothetical protein